MSSYRFAPFMAALGLAGVLVGCAAPQPYDHSALRQAKPRSILVLPPVNESVEVAASPSVLSQSTRPLAEAGYYVMPVALMEETFRQNGLTHPEDIHAVSLAKLREIFGADAVMYLTVKRYGAKYFVVGSETAVEVQARLVDSRTGTLLWNGQARASSEEGKNNNNAGIVGLLITAVLQQVLSNVTEQSHSLAGVASQRLVGLGQPVGLLAGPRHPAYGK